MTKGAIRRGQCRESRRKTSKTSSTSPVRGMNTKEDQKMTEQSETHTHVSSTVPGCGCSAETMVLSLMMPVVIDGETRRSNLAQQNQQGAAVLHQCCVHPSEAAPLGSDPRSKHANTHMRKSTQKSIEKQGKNDCSLFRRHDFSNLLRSFGVRAISTRNQRMHGPRTGTKRTNAFCVHHHQLLTFIPRLP